VACGGSNEARQELGEREGEGMAEQAGALKITFL